MRAAVSKGESMERTQASQAPARSDSRGSPLAPLKVWSSVRPAGAVGTVAALLAGMFGLPTQAQIAPIGTTLNATWQGGSGNAPFNWNASPNWVGNAPPTLTATFPQLANPANASVLVPSNGNLTSIGTLN